MKTKKKRKLKGKDLKKELVKLFKRHPKKIFNLKQIFRKIPTGNKDAIQYTLEQLTKDNKVVAIDDYRYKANKKVLSNGKGQLLTGLVDMTKTGSAYIIVEGANKDVFVAAKNLHSALEGDKVKVKITYQGKRTPEGVVTEIIERSREHFIGTIKVSKKYAFVLPDRLDMPVDIFVPLKESKDAKDGDKVVVKIIEWAKGMDKSPVGKVTSILGQSGSSDIEMKSILINNGFNLEFPEEVQAESEALSSIFPEEEIARRRDMRGITTFTIDPETAKDFDDALSLRYLDNGYCEIGVHIADVTYYVKEGTALDKEAYQRSTSVYLVDRVLPMLPEKISNELCSLRPNEDKFTFSALFTFDKDDKIVERWFGKTIIHSDRRFTYEEAQERLETGKGDFISELKVMNRIAKKLRKEKYKNGAISFEAEEVKFKLDEEGTPISVYVKERKDAHLLIEDFMLLANRAVTEYMVDKAKQKGKEVPFVYRVHDTPDIERLEDFANFALELGYKMQLDTPQQIADSFNNLAKLAKENDELKVLEPLAIRTMAKAIYTTDNIGHYGLGFENYTHFTSPIRRYSDVLVHRILEKNLEADFYSNKFTLEAQCKHVSIQERKAMTAERESIKYKQVEFIEKHVGETFEGIISGIIDRGLFIELKGNRCEGMLPFEQMDESMLVAEGRLKATGKLSGDVYKMGDSIRVTIVSANLAKRQIEFELAEEE